MRAWLRPANPVQRGVASDPAEIAAYRKEFAITFPIHLDRQFTLAKALDAPLLFKGEDFQDTDVKVAR